MYRTIRSFYLFIFNRNPCRVVSSPKENSLENNLKSQKFEIIISGKLCMKVTNIRLCVHYTRHTLDVDLGFHESKHNNDQNAFPSITGSVDGRKF